MKIAEYFDLHNKIKQEIKDKKIQGKRSMKIALLSSFTIRGIKETLLVKCSELGIIPSFYVCDYNQYNQDIINTNSELYKFEPDLLIIFIDTKTILGDQFFLPYDLSNQERKDFINQKLKEIQSLIQNVKNLSSTKILFHNFEVPTYSPFGILENKQEFGFIESIEMLNSNLRNFYKNDTQVFIFNYDAFCSKIGKEKIIDYKMYYLGDIKIDLQCIPKLCDEYLSFIKPMMSLSKKCIVLDLDNTLWGGVIGEDGLEGIKLGPTTQGRAFWEFQKHILSLYKRGIILAVNSKNNFDDVMEVFRKHPYMILKEEHFASMQINWNDKASNLKVIASEINIGLNSLVFFDDDPLNRDIVKNVLPDVLVVDLPKDTSLYSKTLTEINWFDTLQLTEEDKQKGKIYAQQKQRKKFEAVSTNIEEYLTALNMTVTIEEANSFNIPRISQLTQKTNQFNLTTKRYLEEDIRKFADDNKYLCVSIKVKDKFGDNGITGAAIVKKGVDEWTIDTFLLSCRIIGRSIEKTLLTYIAEKAQNEKVNALVGEFISTKKNISAKNFYKENNFTLIKNEDEKQIWKFETIKKLYYPSFIKIQAVEN
jgi:FkbH-like protein